MKLYKFRSAEQIPFALDIILNDRLYCSDWRILNDPLEGQFSYSYRTLTEFTMQPVKNTDYFEDLADQISDEKQKKRVCALSATAESTLLWAHYASGFTGLAIELTIPETEVKAVKYGDQYPLVDMSRWEGTAAAVERALSNKSSEWSYEKEYRIIQDDPWFKLQEPIQRVICGKRMNHATYKGLKIICETRKIPVSRMYIDEEGVDLTGSRSPESKLVKAWEQKKLKQS